MAPPAAEEIEVSVFARGVGECVLVHCGDNHWIVVDSFRGADRRPIALSYLEDLSISPDAIKLVALSHWHDDHVQGAAELVAAATHAGVALPATLCGDEFRALVQQYSAVVPGDFTSGVHELIGVLGALKGRKADRVFALANMVLFERQGIRVDALSPSHEDMEQFMIAMREWAAEGAADKRLSKPRRNDTSVALSVRAGDELLLLGADLEVRGQLSGWQAVHETAWGSRGRASLFKIAHHGSITGHYEPVWVEMLNADVPAVLTPYNRGVKKLPSPEDVNRICDRTTNAFSASATASRSAERQHNSVTRTLAEADIKLYRTPNVGHIRFRKRVAEAGWRIEIFGSGHQLKKNAA